MEEVKKKKINMMMDDGDEPVKKKKRGRPTKASIAAKTKGSRSELGRPTGDNAILQDFKARLLASPKSRRVLDTILDAALDDEHKGQQAAWKLLVDRLMPLSYFDKEKMGNGRASVNITITGVGGDIQTVGGETIEDGE